MNKPQLTAEMEQQFDVEAQARQDERNKVIEEVRELLKHQRLSQKDGYLTDERKRHQNSLRAELRTKLNQLKGIE